MRKADIVSKVADLTGVQKIDVLVTLEAFFREVKNNMKNGEQVYVRGFGSFILKKRKAKIGRDIRRGVAVHIPDHYIPAFKPAKAFSDYIKKNSQGPKEGSKGKEQQV